MSSSPSLPGRSRTGDLHPSTGPGPFAALLALACSTSLHAEGYRGPTAGASDLGTTGGRIAFVDDASAVFHNPANLLDLPRWEASAEPTFVHHSVRYESPAGATARTQDPWKLLPNLYLGGPVNDRLALGLGVSTPWGLSVDWGQGGHLRYSAASFVELKTINFNPSAAIRLVEGVHLGLGLDVMWSELTLEQFYPWAAVAGVPGLPDGELEAKGRGVGVSGNLGLTWQVAEHHRLALTVRPHMNVEYEGDFRASGVPGVPGGQLTLPFGSRMPFPTVAAIGYGYQVTDRLRLASDFEWLNFSQFKSLPLDVPGALPGVPSQLPQNWENSFTAGLSASYDLGGGWRARASYQYFDSPSIDATFSPNIPDANQHAVAVGFGYRQGHHRLDFGYSRVFYEDRVITGNIVPAFNGRYEVDVHLISAAYGFSF